MPYKLTYECPEEAFRVSYHEEGWDPVEVIVYHTYPTHILYPQHNHHAKSRIRILSTPLQYFYTTNLDCKSSRGWFDIRFLLPEYQEKDWRRFRYVEHCKVAIQKALNEKKLSVRWGHPPPRFQRINPETGEWLPTDNWDIHCQIQKGIAEHSKENETTQNDC